MFTIVGRVGLAIAGLLSRGRRVNALGSVNVAGGRLGRTFVVRNLFAALVTLLVATIIKVPNKCTVNVFLGGTNVSAKFMFPIITFALFTITVFVLRDLVAVLLVRS